MTGPSGDGTVVVGIIDDAICFAHERFRLGEGTRVEFAWIQDGIYRGSTAGAFAGTPPVDYGIELCKRSQGSYQGIDALLQQCTHAGVVDEDEVYARTGLVDFRRDGHKAAAWRIAHGTHVADLACGEDPAHMCETRPIVCVQLPAMTTADTSGADLHTYALDAIEYILLRADEIARERGVEHLPVVINFSYGTIGGPHDGTSELEAAIDAIVQWRRDVVKAPLEIVLPAGNSHQSRCHGTVAFQAANETVELAWRTLPDDRTPSFLEIWMPYRTPAPSLPSRIELTLVTPGGDALSPPIGENSAVRYDWQSGGQPICTVRYMYVPMDTERGMFLVTLAPTYSLDPNVATAPCGTWTIRLKNIAMPVRQPIQLWIRRDDTLYGHPRRGRQSHFDAECYQRFDRTGREEENDGDPNCIVQRTRLLNAIATGCEPVVIGGLLRQEMVAAKYSASGPTTPPRDQTKDHRGGPDALCVSDDSRIKHGVLAAGSRSGSVVALNGTSVAAPQIARWIADQLAAGKPGDRNAVRAFAAIPPNLPISPPTPREGAGLIVAKPRTRVPR